MAGATVDVFHPEVGGAGANGDAVVAGLDVGLGDGDIGGSLDMYAVGVGAIAGGRHLHLLELDVLTVVDDDMEDLAVHGCQPDSGGRRGGASRFPCPEKGTVESVLPSPLAPKSTTLKVVGAAKATDDEISAASVGIRACFSVIGEIMPPKRNQQRIEEVYDRNNLNRQIGSLIDQRMVAVVEQLTARIDQLLDRHMDRILPFERTDYVDLQVIVSRAVTSYLRRSPVGGLRRLVPGKGAQKRRADLGPPHYGEATGVLCRGAARNQSGLSPERDWRGGHGSEQGRQHDVTVQTPVHEFDDSGSKETPRKSLVKKSGDRERTPDFGIEDEEPRS
ncbi:hypothetical protein Syun_030227 [Stephania yunnanensis]|uniref:Uncharacterized protein n=1 Tax=Stephania yunnanensis TaxID=152371 RepID=A0AAP0EEN0_9MAGN